MDFEWDESKADANVRKHGVTFWEATEVFGDELSSSVSDPDHSQGEDRFLLLGDHKRVDIWWSLSPNVRRSYESSLRGA